MRKGIRTGLLFGAIACIDQDAKALSLQAISSRRGQGGRAVRHYESEGRVFESPWAHLKVSPLTASGS